MLIATAPLVVAVAGKDPTSTAPSWKGGVSVTQPERPAEARAEEPAETTTSAPSDQGQRGSGQPITLAFGGDVHFEGKIRAQLDRDPSAVFSGVAPLLKAADLAMVNLETAITTRGIPVSGKQYTFRAPPSAFNALSAGGVDLVTMANNHGMDFGRQGLEDSLDAAATAAFPIVGIGRNAPEAYRPYTTTIRGQRLAVIGATQVLDSNLESAWTATDSQPGLASAKNVDRLTAAVRAARGQADTVVVYLHWGTEGSNCPNPAQPMLAEQLIQAGADIIVGGHAHRLQGAGRMGAGRKGGAFVAYGLGNFVFYANAGAGTETGILTVTVTGREIGPYRWTPASLSNQLPRPLTGVAASTAAASWERLRSCSGLAP